MSDKPFEVLLVEDNPADVRLAREAFKTSDDHSVLHVAKDGVEALDYLRKQDGFTDAATPDLILLHLNLPRKDGREVLAEIKGDPSLKAIPVVILTTSAADADIERSYLLHANCYISKPGDLEGFLTVIRSIDDFWLSVVKLPPKGTA